MINEYSRLLEPSDLLKYAIAQMSAEAFLLAAGQLKSGVPLKEALLAGNGYTSRQTTGQVSTFLEHWEIVAQRENTNTGFSGTLIRCSADDPITGAKRSKLILSFRSTKFIDDVVRDNKATNTLEIFNTASPGDRWPTCSFSVEQVLLLVQEVKYVNCWICPSIYFYAVNSSFRLCRQKN